MNQGRDERRLREVYGGSAILGVCLAAVLVVADIVTTQGIVIIIGRITYTGLVVLALLSEAIERFFGRAIFNERNNANIFGVNLGFTTISVMYDLIFHSLLSDISQLH